MAPKTKPKPPVVKPTTEEVAISDLEELKKQIIDEDADTDEEEESDEDDDEEDEQE